MNLIQKECKIRGITRICHFTQSRNLAHIFDDPVGLCSNQTLKTSDMPFNPTDPERFDGRDDLICCSIEYPNVYYFAKVRDQDPLFKDWVVLMIEPSYLWNPGTCFCPCNAARNHGGFIESGLNGFLSLYNSTSPGFPYYTRSSKHLPSAPTDVQAEALLTDPIPIESIIGIAVQSSDQAQREICRLRLQGIMLKKTIYIIPDFFDKMVLPRMIQNGVRAQETIYQSGTQL